MNKMKRHAPAILLITLVAVITPFISGSPALLDTSIVIAIYSLIALSLGYCYGQGGIVSFAQASFAAIGAYATAILTTKFNMDPFVGLAFAVTLPALVSYPLARLLTRLPHLMLAIATLLLGEILATTIRHGGELTGGYVGISGIPTLAGFEDPLKFHILVWIIVIVAVLVYINLVDSPTGRALNTARLDPLRAQADGVDVSHLLSVSFAFCGALAGLAGWLYAHRMTYIAPESLSTHLSMLLLVMVVVGGRRFVLGPILGAVVLTLVRDTLPPEVSGLIFGALLVMFMVLAPGGILGTLRNLWAWTQRRDPASRHQIQEGPK